MAGRSTNLSSISNNDLVLLRKVSRKVTGITVKTGSKKLEVSGIEVSVATAGDLTFVNVPLISAIYRNEELLVGNDVAQAIKELKQSGRSPRKSRAERSDSPKLPVELQKQLEAFAKENGSRVVFDPTKPGGYKVQKFRNRRKKLL